jgi:hypothetical protein
MFYNHIYNLQFKGLDQVGTDLYYQVKFEKQEATVEPYEIIELIPAQDSPFILNYRANKDNIFAPIRASYADIKCFIPYNSAIQPSDFFFENDEYSLKISLYETNGVTEDLKWVGFLLPDVIQYEWQEQYYLQLTATDNIAVLKDIKYTRQDYYALYDDTNVDTCIDINDFVCRLLKKTGSELDVAFFSQFKLDGTLVNLANLKVSEYSSVDWSTFEPKDCYFLLGSLMESLGCVVYQSNKDATWYVVAINDLAVNDLVTDGEFSISGALPPLYEYWTTDGDVINSSTGGLNGSQCPKIFGDNVSNVYQTLVFQAAEYTVSFWAKNFDAGAIPKAVVRIEIDGVEVFSQSTTDDWVYYEFTYTSVSAGSFEIKFFNNNDDSTGYLLIDNVSVKQKFQNGLIYDINGTYLDEYTFDFYSSIGNAGNVKWSDVNQVVTLNKRLTNVQFYYPYYERNLINNYGFFKDTATTTTTPTDWELESPFDFANATGEDRPFDNRILSVIENEDITGGLNLDNYLSNTFRLTNNISPFGFYNFFAIKVECSVYFDDSHTDGDGINIALVKSRDGEPSNFTTRYLDSTGTYFSVTTSSLWNAVFRMPIFMSDKNRWMKYKCFSKFDQNSLADGTTLYEFATLVLRPQRSFDTANVHQTYFDDIKVSIIPQGYKNTKGFIYNATNIPNDATMVKPFSNTYKIDKGQYHGGIANKSESQIIEDFIGYDTGGELNLIQNSNRWFRTWETDEILLGRPMQECITRSILSFYQSTWDKFTGNVYGKNINFGQVFTIALAQGLHFMHEASFDYVSNKTNITTHQSQTDKLETGFRSWSTTKDDTGAGQGEPGSTTSSIQEAGE